MRWGLYSGILQCLRQGILELLVAQHGQRAADPLARSCGMITSSMKPRAPATNGLANLALYSASRCASFSGIALLLAEDDLDRALRPHDGNLGRRPGKFTSPRRCFDDMTS